MRELSFAGFLKQYVRELSYGDTCSLYALAREAAHDNPRLREPLLLYALFSGKADVLRAAVKDPTLKAQYDAVLSHYDRETMALTLEADNAGLPEAYRKVWRSYQNRKNRRAWDDETKALMRERILFLQKELGVSNYRLYTDLKLNPGNMNAWLKHGTSEKIALATARRTLQYLERM